MIVVDSKTGDPWASELATDKLRQIRGEVINEFRARDTRVSKGRMCDANGFKTYTFKDAKGQSATEGDKSIAGQYVLQNDLVAMRHTGKDVRLETTRRWIEFCSEPQDQAAVAESVAILNRDRQISKARVFVESGKDSGLTPADAKSQPTSKRHGGRPKGSKNKPKEEPTGGSLPNSSGPPSTV